MPRSLRLADFSDEEVLALLVDLADNEGWVSSETYAESVQLPIQNVGSRLSWLRRWGVVERDARPGVPTRGFWRLTEMGEAVVQARFSKSQQNAFSSLSDPQLLRAMESLAGQYEAASFSVANLVRRRFLYSTYRRK